MLAPFIAIRQSDHDIAAYTLNKDGSYNTCILNVSGDLIGVAKVCQALGFGSQFRLDRVKNNKIIACSGLACLKICGLNFKWQIIPSECLIGIPLCKINLKESVM